jgi:hypothetical protein
MDDSAEHQKRRAARSMFVVRIDPQDDSATLRGRAEHVWSSQVVEFDSGQALLEFLRRLADHTRR